jgi:hypothetical protein
MTISAKILNDNLKKISDTNDLLDMLIEMERVMDSIDLYAYKNWFKGEILEGPKLDRHYVNVTLMYPYKEMPDPSGAKRLIAKECLVDFKKDTLITPRRVKTFDDVQMEMRPDGTQRFKAKTDSSPVWLVKISMPRRYVDEFDPDIIKADEDSYVDLEDAAAVSAEDAIQQEAEPEAPAADLGI